jgi:hypothetical protein
METITPDTLEECPYHREYGLPSLEDERYNTFTQDRLDTALRGRSLGGIEVCRREALPHATIQRALQWKCGPAIPVLKVLELRLKT